MSEVKQKLKENLIFFVCLPGNPSRPGKPGSPGNPKKMFKSN
jgi:hypothetical protein